MTRSALVCFIAAILVGGVSDGTWAHGSWHGGARSMNGGGFRGHRNFDGHSRHFNRFHNRFFFGAFIGDPFFRGPYPYYSYPPAVYEQEAPPVYVQQSGYWYYCPTSNAYFPYVSSCNVPWQQVAPQPPQ